MLAVRLWFISQMVDPNGNLNLLYANRNVDGVKLNWNYGKPDNEWNPDNQFLFELLRNSLHFSSRTFGEEFCYLLKISLTMLTSFHGTSFSPMSMTCSPPLPVMTTMSPA